MGLELGLGPGLYNKTLSLFRSTNDEKSQFIDLQNRLPNIPVFGWLSMKNMTDDGGARCSEYPRLSDLHYNNKYWQMFQFLSVNPKTNVTSDMNFYLFGAYLDNRTLLGKLKKL